MEKLETIKEYNREQFTKTLLQLLIDYATQLQNELQSLLSIDNLAKSSNETTITVTTTTTNNSNVSNKWNVINNNDSSSINEEEVERPEEVYRSELADMSCQLRRIRNIMRIIQETRQSHQSRKLLSDVTTAEKTNYGISMLYKEERLSSTDTSATASWKAEQESNAYKVIQGNNNNNHVEYIYKTDQSFNNGKEYDERQNNEDGILMMLMNNNNNMELIAPCNISLNEFSVYKFVTRVLRCIRLEIAADEPICDNAWEHARRLLCVNNTQVLPKVQHRLLPISKFVSLPEVMREVFGRNTHVHLRRRKRSLHHTVNEETNYTNDDNAMYKKQKSEHPSLESASSSICTMKRDRLTSTLLSSSKLCSHNNTFTIAHGATEKSVIKTNVQERVNLPFFARLALEQSDERDDIYSGKAPQFPVLHFDSIAYNEANKMTSDKRYLSPALRSFITLSMEAEGKMAVEMHKVKTKLQLLLDMPKLKAEVECHRHDWQEEHTVISSINNVIKHIRRSLTKKDMLNNNNNSINYKEEEEEEQEEEYLVEEEYASLNYFSFPCTNDGVVRVVVQQALVMDLTFDLNTKQWCLLLMQWSLFTTPLGGLNTDKDNATYEISCDEFTVQQQQQEQEQEQEQQQEEELVSKAISSEEEQDLNVNDNNYCCKDSEKETESAHRLETCTLSTASLDETKIVIPHGDIMYRYLQHHFQDDGFASGCMAANRLVNTVVLDIVIAQLTELQRNFFVGPLSSMFSLEVRTGTFVAWRCAIPSYLHDKQNWKSKSAIIIDDVANSYSTVGNNNNDNDIDNINNKSNVSTNVENTVLHFKAYIKYGNVLCDVITNTNVLNKKTFCILSPATKHNKSVSKSATTSEMTLSASGAVIDVVKLVFSSLY